MMKAITFLLLTVLLYGGAKKLYRAKPAIVLSPLLVTPIALIIILSAGHISFADYNEGGKWLTRLIGPATVALAVPLHEHFDILKKHAKEIALGTLGGSLMGFLSALEISRLLHLHDSLLAGIMLRSTTTPIALAVSSRIGGASAITAVIVLITGLLGMTTGPFVIRALRIRSECAKGVLMGTSAHTAGSYKAFELGGGLAGAIATVSMLATALLTLGLLPWIMSHFA